VAGTAERLNRARAWAAARGQAALLAATLAGLGGGALAHLTGAPQTATALWTAAALVGIGCSLWWLVQSVRRRQLGVDAIALLALFGTLAVGEPLAGAVISVMLASGRALEAAAADRARRDLRLLLERAPATARRRVADRLETVPVQDVAIGDTLVVGTGDVVPVDGAVVEGDALLDESALTGEPVPVQHPGGDLVRSGVVNAGAPFALAATTTAAESTYAGIVRLVREAQSATPPFVRLADRIAGWFLLATLAVCAAAWGLSGQPARAVAVLVVATPCPLVLAAPVAAVSGLSRTARRGVVVKGGAVLEALAACRTLLLDKTGTLTLGRPALASIVTAGGRPPDDVVRLAASVDQVSNHVLAAAVVRAAADRGLVVDRPAAVTEIPGGGVRGEVAGHRITVGSAALVGTGADDPWTASVERRAALDAALVVYVAVDGAPAGALLFDDPIRADASRTIRALRRGGISRVVMVTGDRAEAAEMIGAAAGTDEVLAGRSPEQKVAAVRAERRAAPTVMVGDGINDAPALALADVGVAIGARGYTASSEAADIVLTVDRLDRLAEALTVARRTRRIAAQSAAGGIGLSLAAMFAAALGYLPAVWGALLQEAIDIAAILNSLRVLRPDPQRVRLDDEASALTRRFAAEHSMIRDVLEQVRTAADALDDEPLEPATQLCRVRAVHERLAGQVLPHEEAEDSLLYPAMARTLGGIDPTATMSRAHVEIARDIARIGRILDTVDPAAPRSADLVELRRVLHGLHAVLSLHTEQEEESYLSLADPGPACRVPDAH
jgi:heavy metal translocating P-type ATPase